MLVISISIAGFFAYQTQQLVKELTALKSQEKVLDTSEPTSEPVATESSEIDPTADWKTYSGDIFSFKYPNDWNYYQPKVEGDVLRLYIAPKDTITDISEMFSRGGGFGGGKFLTMTMSEVDEVPPYKSDEYQKFTSSIYKLDSVKATEYFAEALLDMLGLDAGDKTETIVFKKGNKNYMVSLVDYQYKTIFDQILSTFKFLE
ncbi:MAG: hypothetical protein WA152_03245 [Microgenomates group bacterium]